MEQKHEEWVLATLNFLGIMLIDAYDGGWNANSLEGMNLPKGEMLEIPRRIDLMRKKHEEQGRELSKVNLAWYECQEQLHNVRQELAEAQDVLHKIALLPEVESAVLVDELRLAAEEAAKEEEDNGKS